MDRLSRTIFYSIGFCLSSGTLKIKLEFLRFIRSLLFFKKLYKTLQIQDRSLVPIDFFPSRYVLIFLKASQLLNCKTCSELAILKAVITKQLLIKKWNVWAYSRELISNTNLKKGFSDLIGRISGLPVTPVQLIQQECPPRWPPKSTLPQHCT